MLCDCFCAERAWAVNNFIYLCLIKNKTFWHYCSIGFIYILLVIFLSSFCGPVNLKLLSLWIDLHQQGVTAALTTSPLLLALHKVKGVESQPTSVFRQEEATRQASTHLSPLR